MNGHPWRPHVRSGLTCGAGRVTEACGIVGTASRMNAGAAGRVSASSIVRWAPHLLHADGEGNSQARRVREQPGREGK
jgi:hypothetical protein